MTAPKFISAGYVSLDITPTFPDGNCSSKELFRPGALAEIQRATIAVGGSVSNTGLALHKFGADTTLIAKIGHDDFGSMIVERYKKFGVDPSFIVSEKDETGYTIAIAPPGHDRTFLADPGANNTMIASDIPDEVLQRSSFFHFGYPTLMKGFYQNNGEETITLYRRAKTYGLVTSLDLTVVDRKSMAAKEDWPTIFQKLLPYVDFFTPSFEEICMLVMPYHYQSLLEKAEGDDICSHLSLSEDIRPLADVLLSLGCKAVLLKCGAAGIYLKTTDQDVMNQLNGIFNTDGWGNQDYFADSFKPYRIVSGTGAGDTAIAAFLYSVAQGYSPKECVDNAAGTGAMNITEYDSLSGLIPIADLMKKIRSGWERQHMIKA